MWLIQYTCVTYFTIYFEFFLACCVSAKGWVNFTAIIKFTMVMNFVKIINFIKAMDIYWGSEFYHRGDPYLSVQEGDGLIQENDFLKVMDFIEVMLLSKLINFICAEIKTRWWTVIIIFHQFDFIMMKNLRNMRKVSSVF